MEDIGHSFSEYFVQRINKRSKQNKSIRYANNISAWRTLATEGALHWDRCAGALGGQAPRRRRRWQAAVWAVAAGSGMVLPRGPCAAFLRWHRRCSLSRPWRSRSRPSLYAGAAAHRRLSLFAIWHVSSRGRGRRGEVVAQPLLAPGPSSGRPRIFGGRHAGDGARPGRCRPRGRGSTRPLRPRVGSCRSRRSRDVGRLAGCARGVPAQAARAAAFSRAGWGGHGADGS